MALAMLEAPDDLVGGEAFNVGSADQNYLVRDLAEVLADVTGCEVEFATDASPDPRSYRVDFSSSRACSRRSHSSGMHAVARRSWWTPTARFRSPTELFEGRRFVRLASSATCSTTASWRKGSGGATRWSA